MAKEGGESVVFSTNVINDVMEICGDFVEDDHHFYSKVCIDIVFRLFNCGLNLIDDFV